MASIPETTESIETTDVAPSEAPVENAIVSSEAQEVSSEPAPETLKESPRDTVARLLKETVTEEPSTPNEEAPKAEKVRTKTGQFVAKGKASTQPSDEKYDPELYAPQRLKPEAKKIFDSAPPELRREVHRMFKEHEALATKTQQTYQQAYQNVQSVAEIIRPFAPKWAERGITVPQALGELCSTFEKLADPQRAVSEYVSLGQRLGVNFGRLSELVNSGQVNIQQPTNQQNNFAPQIEPLQQRINQLESHLVQQQVNQQIAPAVSSLRAVMDQVDPESGQLRYPEFHDNDYLLSLKPRVAELVGTIPNLPYPEALLRANDERRAKLFGNSYQPIPTRFQSGNTNQQINQRAVNAAVTVRGKTSPLLSNQGGESKPPPEALKDARATTRWVLNNLRNGGGA